MKLFRYLLHRPTWQKLPLMPRQYSTEFDAKQVDYDTAMLMSMAHVRSPHGVKLLLRKHNASSARELVEKLPARRRPRRLGARALGLVRRALGVTPYDPMKKIARPYIRRARRQLSSSRQQR